MKIYLLFIFSLLSVFQLSAQQKDTVHVADFGVKPYSYENSVEKLQAAIQACKQQKAKVLAFEKGRYDFWPEGAVRKEYFITNTSTEQECPSKVKTIGILFENMEGLTIEGNNATLMFHGKMTMIAFAHCKQMKLNNLHIDFERPGGSEITYTKVDSQGVEVALHRDSRYEIADGQIHLYGEGWRSNKNHCIQYDPENEHFFYCNDWNTLAASKATEVSPGVIRFSTPSDFRPKTGNTLTVRDIIRDQVGMFIYESRDITLNKIGMHYMHGLGIVSQYTRNITMKEVNCEPREGSGRILASSADFMHFSGCSGKINILGCRYAGAQDDPINVHGTNLRAIEQVNDKTLKLRFMHGQSYGFNAYFEGDTVAFVKAATMERFASAKVTSAKRLTDRTIEVSFDRNIPNGLELNHDCVENITCTPEVEIRNCYFTRTSTRGTLMTTPRKVVIADNTYYKTGMSAILIEGDAEGWYESGPVKDVLIQNNTFIDCTYNGGPGNAVIAIHPSNTIVDANHPVHRNIRIIGNTFQTWGNPVVYAKSTEGLVFENNSVTCSPETDMLQKEMFILNGCKNVTIKDNILPKGFSSKNIRFENMKKKYKR
ncbi:alpha-1,3-galactosidase-related protein [Phocaeicola sp.]